MLNSLELVRVCDEFFATVVEDFDEAVVLRALADGVRRVLSLDAAGVMTAGPGPDRLRAGYATDERAAALEAYQEEHQDGPCSTAVATGRVVHVPDLGTPGPWPGFQAVAVAAGVRAVSSVPLVARGRSWGVLDLYHRGAHAWEEPELVAARQMANLATSYVVIAHDRAEAQRVRDELAHRVAHDPVTGLPVREVLLGHLEHAVARLRRPGPGGRFVAVLFLDIDGLKAVNDEHGHAVGDELIAACAARAHAALRPEDVLARFGGDEFVALVQGLDSPREALAVAERLRARTVAPLLTTAGVLNPSVSVGVCATDDPRQPTEHLIATADRAMYAAKRAGQGRCVLLGPGIPGSG